MKMHLGLIVIKFFDLHCDTLTECYKRNVHLHDSSLAVNVKGTESFKKYIQNFAVFIGEDAFNPVKEYRGILKYGKKILTESGIDICTSADSLKKSLDKSRMSAILSLEGGAPIKSLSVLDELFYGGVRVVSLTWNYTNQLAGGALDDGGLTDFGRKVIGRMNELGLVLDVSHLNRKSFFEATLLADRVMATHSCLFDLVPHKRNLDKQQLKLLNDKIGIVGLCFYPEFLGMPVFEKIEASIYYMLEQGFGNLVSIGSDFDGATMDEKLFNLECLPALYEYLLSKSIEKETLNNIFFDNSYNFFTRVLTNTQNCCNI